MDLKQRAMSLIRAVKTNPRGAAEALALVGAFAHAARHRPDVAVAMARIGAARLSGTEPSPDHVAIVAEYIYRRMNPVD